MNNITTYLKNMQELYVNNSSSNMNKLIKKDKNGFIKYRIFQNNKLAWKKLNPSMENPHQIFLNDYINSMRKMQKGSGLFDTETVICPGSPYECQISPICIEDDSKNDVVTEKTACKKWAIKENDQIKIDNIKCLLGPNGDKKDFYRNFYAKKGEKCESWEIKIPKKPKQNSQSISVSSNSVDCEAEFEKNQTSTGMGIGGKIIKKFIKGGKIQNDQNRPLVVKTEDQKCRNSGVPECLENDGGLFSGKKACTKWTPGIECLETNNFGKDKERDRNKNLLGEKGMKCMKWNILPQSTTQTSSTPNVSALNVANKCLNNMIGNNSACGRSIPICLENDGGLFSGKKACTKWPESVKCLKTNNKGKETAVDRNKNLIGEKGMECIEWVLDGDMAVNAIQNKTDVEAKIKKLLEKYPKGFKAVSGLPGKCTDPNTDLFIDTNILHNGKKVDVCVKLEKIT